MTFYGAESIPGDGTVEIPSLYHQMNQMDERLLVLSCRLLIEIRRLPIPYDVMYRVKVLLRRAYDEGHKEGHDAGVQAVLDSPESYFRRPDQ